MLLGEFASNCRSALNYTSRVILEREVVAAVGFKRAKKLRKNLDFPWADNEERFDHKPIIRASSEVAESLHRLLKRFQPFNPSNKWLGHLMILSNRDKHVVTNVVRSASATSFLSLLPDGTQLKEPQFMGDKLLIFEERGPIGVDLPFYYSPLRSFATSRKTWSLYLVPFSQSFSLDLVDYTRTAPLRVTQILAALDARLGGRQRANRKNHD